MYKALMQSPDGRTQRRAVGTAYIGALLAGGWEVVPDNDNRLPEGYGPTEKNTDSTEQGQAPKRKKGRPRKKRDSPNGGR